MKKVLIKLLCLSLAFALALTFAGCKEEVDLSSTPTNTQTNTNVQDSAYVELNNRTVSLILYKYLDMNATMASSTDTFVESLNLVENFKLYQNDTIMINHTTYYKTNVKYADFEQEMSSFLSENFINNSEYSPKWFYTEMNDYLYIDWCGATGYSVSVPDVRFVEFKNGIYTYTADYEVEAIDGVYTSYVKANIVKENGVFVLDSIEYISKEETAFNGYTELNNNALSEIIEENIMADITVEMEPSLLIRNYVADVIFEETNDFGKTNIKLKDFENGALKYMSKNRFEKDILSTNRYIEKDGILCYDHSDGGSAIGYEVLEIKLEKEQDGIHTILAKILQSYEISDEICYARVNIVKENGIFVVDSYELLSADKVSFKTYDKLDQNTAKNIIENGLNLKSEIISGSWYFCQLLGFKEYEEYQEAEFKEKMCNFMSENFYLCDEIEILNSEEESRNSIVVIKAELQSETADKAVYIAKCKNNLNNNPFRESDYINVKATIIKQNGNYVLDSAEEIK